MKLLLDTHTFLWIVEGSPTLRLISQSHIEGMTLASGDTKLPPYGIPILW